MEEIKGKPGLMRLETITTIVTSGVSLTGAVVAQLSVTPDIIDDSDDFDGWSLRLWIGVGEDGVDFEFSGYTMEPSQLPEALLSTRLLSSRDLVLAISNLVMSKARLLIRGIPDRVGTGADVEFTLFVGEYEASTKQGLTTNLRRFIEIADPE